MTPELWQRVQQILHEALQRAEEDRTAFLDEACAGDEELRREVESLLAGAEDSKDFIEEPVVSLRPDESRTPTEADGPAGNGGEAHPEGSRIGPYEVLAELGRGGMGKVLRAVRADDEFEKVVAIKLLTRGRRGDEIVRRFRHERQILAHLDHPNIAELFDGGTTEEGLPYFVMEYIEGIRIDRYCDEHRLGIRQRLELFRKVCSAVHSAHQSLVVHRDLKPGNILVTEQGEPKLLDFGIAKLLATEASEDEPTRYQLTMDGSSPMTPGYASPEQIQNKVVTTASDVYSLGVLLYQLLSGRRPYRFRPESFAGFVRALTEEEPRKPSDAVLLPEAGAGDEEEEAPTPESVSLARSSDPRSLRRRLAGDLDAIVFKAMRKEPRERYGSVEQLSEDIRRHLQGRPVVARRGTFLYQTSKFLRRHRVSLAGAAAILLTIFFGLRSMVSARQAERERQVAQSLSTLFQSLQGLGPRAAEDPVVMQRIEDEVRENIDDMELATILNEQAQLLERQGGFETAEVLYRQALDMAIRLSGKVDGDGAVLTNNLAAALEAQGEYEEAERLYHEALEVKIAVYERQSESTARALNNLGTLLQNKGDLDAAEPFLRESLDIRRKEHGPDAPQVGVALNNYAFLLQAQGHTAEAEAGYRHALRILRAELGLDHFRVGIALRNLATLLRETGDHENAEKTARQALEIFQKTYLKHWRVADAESVVGETLVARGLYDEAEPLLSESYTVISATKGKNARQTREALRRLEYLEEARRKNSLD